MSLGGNNFDGPTVLTGFYSYTELLKYDVEIKISVVVLLHYFSCFIGGGVLSLPFVLKAFCEVVD